MGGGSHYDSEEQVIGEWIDGTPIYQKTIELASTITVFNNSWTQVSDIVIPKCKQLIDIKGYGPNGQFRGGISAFCSDESSYKLNVNSVTDTTVKVFTIQYTKATD